jgi:putative hydrolase of the HAD superfamily
VLPRKIDAVLFDLDDTLHDDTAAYMRAAARVAENVSRERGINPHALEDAYAQEIHRFWGGLSASDLRTKIAGVRRTLWQRALASVGIDDAAFAERCAKEYDEYRRDYFTLYPGALELLQELRREGKRLGLVTNGFAETHYDKIALLRLRELFDGIFIADEVGMVKPDPQIFIHACESLGSSPGRAAMVGDRYERDIRGGAEAGLFTVWVNVRNEQVPPGAPPPDAVCSAISDVGSILYAVEAASNVP